MIDFDSILLIALMMLVIGLSLVFVLIFPRLKVYLFFLFACILPSYFAIEVTSSLPLISGSRILILLIALYAFTHKKRYSFRETLKKQKLGVVFGIYFGARILAEVYFLPTITGYALKELFCILFEELLVVYAIVQSITSRRMFDKCVELLSYGAIGINLVGIVQSVTGINLAYFLNSVNRTMLQTNGFRLGFTRAEASFGHPVYFGFFCVLMLPVFSYLLDYKKEKKYILYLIIDIVALILSNSRGAILPGMVILLWMIMAKNAKNQKKYLFIGVVSCTCFIIISFFFPVLATTALSIGKSILNMFGVGFELNDYGGNLAGLDSRITQLSGIRWVIMHGKVLFGFGPDAHMRGYISYFINNQWNSLPTIDVGYVGFFLCEGIVGIFGNLTLIFGLIFRAVQLRIPKSSNDMNNAFKFIFIGHSVLLLSATGVDLLYWTLIGLFIAYNRIEGNYENK